MSNIRIFILIWLGQFISITGSSLTSFGIDLWIYQQTGSVTQYALVALFNTVPPILVSPIAGVLIDRWDRRKTMIISDFMAGVATLFIALLFLNSRLQIWHICSLIAVVSICNIFQRLASTTVIPLLVAQKHLGRASGLWQTGESLIELFTPVLAGVLFLNIQLQGIFIIDFLTYFFSLTTLLMIKLPKLKPDIKSKDKNNQGVALLRKDIVSGWNYITSQPVLLGLLIYFAASNFIIGIVSILLIPMLLTFVSSAAAGLIISISSIGTVIGSLLMGIWGGPKKLINGILVFGILLGVCILLAGLRPSLPLITIATFGGLFCFPLITGCSEALFWGKVETRLQGRVFALQGMIASSALPLAYVLAGYLADYVFEPLLDSSGLLAGNIGKIIGVGAGRGMGLLFIILGIIQIVLTIYSYCYLVRLKE